MSQQFPPQYSGNLPPYPPNQPQQTYSQYPQQPMQEHPPFQQYPQQPPPGYYPPQGPYAPPPKKSRKGLWIALAIGLIAILAVCSIAGMAASGASKTATTTTTSTGAQSTTSSSSSSTANHQPGELVNVDDTWDVTINKVSTSAGDGSLNVPKSGNTFLLIDVTEKNISSDQQNASGLVQYTLRGTDGTKYDQAITMGTDPGGAVSAGQTIKGKLAYEVPKSVKNFTLAFQSDLGSTQVMWDIHR